MSEPQPTLRHKLQALRRVAGYRPVYAVTILLCKLVAALFEGIGLVLLLPIIEFAMADGDAGGETSQIATYFIQAYELVGVPATLETLLLGLAAVITLRYTISFCIGWLQASLAVAYMADLRRRAYENLLAADIAYVDEQDGDEIVNTIVTEIRASARVIGEILGAVEKLLFAIVYTTVALVLSPVLTITSVLVLALVAVSTRYGLDTGYGIGDQLAKANEEIQSHVNAGTRGLREIKLFNMESTLNREFDRAHDRLVDTRVRLERNQMALSNFNQLLNAFVVFALVYLAIEYLALEFATLGTFLFAIYRLSPLVSRLNNTLYSIDGALPHLVRAQTLIGKLDDHADTAGTEPAPTPTTTVTADDVSFRYDDDAEGTDVTNVSLRVERGETIALVGPSGAGKSTIVSLLARLYDPDDGRIYANGVALDSIDLESWHERVTVVPQQPFLFNETLRYNVTIGDPDASDDAVERACNRSQVTAFLEELPEGLDTELGDDGVRLSGGQRQRIAIARALLADADVLILDEATSELDSPTEKAILEGIDAMDRDYATIVIGHWLSTVKDADRIYTVVDGRIVESGTHQELLAADTQYAELYGSQIAATAPSREGW
ncbi:ABC transporter ATP-binding protein [Salinadaptatus halalkaliphilus]|uniref:ABC transporter ATP-binding protein n=1 Tax=Salinadaptatus halalkaliphilus TaxID=2419781 RepID=A0A4S3TLV3_9EURY|nr:ABC transporter ATP-binding protein [Salinadaptatus halalkaliphilus]THE65149.1 ABC transporter ATP-binding protein [Salinadaptatus halalkaliphilus]